jgi:para-nitrobenzyl esterase
VVAFRGIPYAASPIGELRFAPPCQHPGWSTVREAAVAGPAVPQRPSRLEPVQGRRTPDWNEDGCLTLNVWSPRRALDGGSPRPALVWFHGGGFASGSGGWDWYDGALLAELGDIVVVTANYRVGPLGYLHLPHIGADNLGVQDQAAVLHWVKDNIAVFGGDPGAVTVGGQSAGAYSALSLALAPDTGSLVRRVIAQSGPWGMPPQDPDVAAANTSAYLGILGVEADADPGKALRALPVERLLAAYGRLAADKGRPGDVAPPMYPVLGGSGMPRAWRQALADGALEGKDILLGTTHDEMTAFLAFDQRIQALTRDEVLRILTGQIGDAARTAYEGYAAQHRDATPAQVLTAVETEVVFRTGTMEIAGRQAAGHDAAYVYQFDYHPNDDDNLLGATHCIDLPFLFGTFDAYSNSPMLGRTRTTLEPLWRAFAGALAAFVATGSPNGEGLTPWLPYLPGQESRVLRFGQ